VAGKSDTEKICPNHPSHGRPVPFYLKFPRANFPHLLPIFLQRLPVLNRTPVFCQTYRKLFSVKQMANQQVMFSSTFTGRGAARLTASGRTAHQRVPQKVNRVFAVARPAKTAPKGTRAHSGQCPSSSDRSRKAGWKTLPRIHTDMKLNCKFCYIIYVPRFTCWGRLQLVSLSRRSVLYRWSCSLRKWLNMAGSTHLHGTWYLFQIERVQYLSSKNSC
jgi:hypothetical protein